MKNYLIVITSALILFSCRQNKVCECLDESTANLKEVRLSGFKKDIGDPGPICKSVEKEYAKKDKKKMEQEIKQCSGFKEYKQEMKLFTDNMMQSIKESFGDELDSELGDALKQLEDEMQK